MKNVQKITLAAVLAIATSPVIAKWPTCPSMPKLNMPAMPELNGKNALIATATVAAAGGLYVAYNKGLISKAALAIQDIVTTHPRKTAAVLVTATALVVANHFGYLDGAKDAITSLFKKAEVKAVKDAANIEGAAKDINNVVDNAGSNEAPKVPSEVPGNAAGSIVDANVKPGTSDIIIVDAPVLNDNAEIVKGLASLTAKVDDLMSTIKAGNSIYAAEMTAVVNDFKSVVAESSSANAAKVVEAINALGLKIEALLKANNSGATVEIIDAIQKTADALKADNAVQATTIVSAVKDVGHSVVENGKLVVENIKNIFTSIMTKQVSLTTAINGPIDTAN